MSLCLRADCGYPPVAASPSPLERRENLEQLRALELGLTIWAAAIDAAPISVDTPADLAAARAHAARLMET